MGIQRDVAMSVPSFTAAAAIASRSDWVALLPASLLAVLGAPFGLCALRTAVALPAVTMALCWHERTQSDAAMVSFRELVRRALGAPARRPEPAPGAGAVRRPRSARALSVPRGRH
jgi:DNA-binding transcriptional LysR family regulator